MAQQAPLLREQPQPSAKPATPPGIAGAPEAVFLGLSRKALLAFAGLVFLANLPLLHYLLRGRAPVSFTLPPAFEDSFERAELGPNYFSTGGDWRIEKGVLHSPGVKNNPLWLKASLPRDVAVSFDVRGESSDGDIKCELFGDGRDHASGYVLILGGWSNSISVIARLDEHGRDRKEDRSWKVEKGRTYHFRIERKGADLRWYVDNQLFMEWDDPAPLAGPGHDRFAFSSWDSDLYFDNLRIEPL